MSNRVLNYFSSVIIFCISANVLANDTVNITVKTNEVDAAAVGFKVEGKNYGRLGKSYSKRMPGNKEFKFGYRKGSIFGENVDCGSIVLIQDSTITLIKQDNKCASIIN